MKYLKTTDEALCFLTECTLATVASLAMKKSKSKSEFARQISIAQKGIDFIKQFNCMIEVESRVYTVITYYDGSVENYSKKFQSA